jgi:glycogen debranching enzyme
LALLFRDLKSILYFFYRRYLAIRPKLEYFKLWLEKRLNLVAKLPGSLVPKYFFLVIMLAYQGIKYRAIEMSSSKNVGSSSFTNLLNLCKFSAFQMYGIVSSTTLFPFKYPKQIYLSTASTRGLSSPNIACLAAGLPHFSTNYMRCWGRDVCISLRGMFLLSGHFDQARAHIIAFGSTLKHGLIPNLLDQGIKPRYNARDAAWWWLLAVAEYCRLSDEGTAFLGIEVARRFVPCRRYTRGENYGRDYDIAYENAHADEYIEPSHPLAYSYTNTIAELCHEILERHARGIHFREWNAGPNLDHAMSQIGFDIDICTLWENDIGFVSGGSKMNCGTWMDKMGDSVKAKNKGFPATPRDGADIEIVGLLKSFLNWIVNDLIDKVPHWKWNHVTKGTKSLIFMG